MTTSTMYAVNFILTVFSKGSSLCNKFVIVTDLSSCFILQYRQEVDTMDMFENNVAAHLTRILNSSKHSEVISSARCELLCNIRLYSKETNSVSKWKS